MNILYLDTLGRRSLHDKISLSWNISSAAAKVFFHAAALSSKYFFFGLRMLVYPELWMEAVYYSQRSKYKSSISCLILTFCCYRFCSVSKTFWMTLIPKALLMKKHINYFGKFENIVVPTCLLIHILLLCRSDRAKYDAKIKQQAIKIKPKD